MKAITAYFLTVISFFCSIFGLPTYPHGAELDLTDYELVWSDEFNADKLDLSTWTAHYGYAADESGSYIRKGGYWNTDMCTVKDGALHIEIKYYPDGYKNNGKPGWYTCGIDTSKSFSAKQGYFECRCILPKGVGLWSAFWIYTGEMVNVGNEGIDGSEIDVFESAYYSTVQKNSVSSAIHYDGYGDAHQSKQVCHSRVTANDPYENYNTYGVEWNEDEYIFYINGVESGRSSFGGVSQVPEWLILSVEVGGSNGEPAKSWAGQSIEKNKSAPTDFIVDYVRVYQK